MSPGNIPYSIASNAKHYLQGIAAERAQYYKTQAEQASAINRYVSTIYDDFREAYDSFVPNVHVLNVDVFTDIISDWIVNTASKKDPGSPIIEKFSNKSSVEVRGLRTVILNSVRAYHNSLLARQNGVTDPVQKLNDLAQKLFTETKNIDNVLVARSLGTKFARLVIQLFGPNKAMMAAESSYLGSSDTTYVFFSKSFSSIGPAIRKNVYKKVENYLIPILQSLQVDELKLGGIVNMGHAALVNELEAFTNSPAFASIAYGVGSGRSLRMRSSDVREAAEVFKLESGLLENSLTVEKQLFSAENGYGVLLALGVTFTNVEDAEINQARGRTTESAAVRSFRIQKPVVVSPAVQAREANLILKRVLRNDPLSGRSSRSIIEFIEEVLRNLLIGKKTSGEKTSHTYKSKSKVLKPVPKKSTPSKFEQPKIEGSRSGTSGLRNLKGQFSSLTTLQNILNSRLATVIAKNMGDGDRRDILNYRTGRFANSAKVERLSQSREGMITAFYTYMKYPYQTFEPEFRQGSPASRNPKLLISKSIREILAEQVKNRLRAVSV